MEYCVKEVSCKVQLEESDVAFESKVRSSMTCSAQSQSLEIVRSVFGLYSGSNDSTFIYSI
jgi:hypothetical protein